VSLHELEDAARIAQGQVALGIALPVELVLPRIPLVGLGQVGIDAALAGRLEAGEEAAPVGGGLERGIDEEGGVGVVDDVVLEVEVVLDGVADQPAEAARGCRPPRWCG